MTPPEEAAERHYGTPPLQPKESAIHSYLMWSKLSLITPHHHHHHNHPIPHSKTCSLMLISLILGCVHRSVRGNHRALSCLHRTKKKTTKKETVLPVNASFFKLVFFSFFFCMCKISFHRELNLFHFLFI